MLSHHTLIQVLNAQKDGVHIDGMPLNETLQIMPENHARMPSYYAVVIMPGKGSKPWAATVWKFKGSREFSHKITSDNLNGLIRWAISLVKKGQN